MNHVRTDAGAVAGPALPPEAEAELPDEPPAFPDAAAGRPARFDRGVYFLILLLGAMSALGPLAIDMYLPSFPAIAEGFGTTVAAVQRTLAAYFVGLALGQLVYGPAADRFGRKPPLYVGLVIFVAASVGCALAGNVGWLIAARFLQALGGCSAVVVARAVVRDRFDERDAARVFSLLMLVLGVAPIVAPILGGWFATHTGWRAIFWFLSGASLLCLVAMAIALPESLPAADRRRRSVGEIGGVYAMLLRDRTFMVHALAGSLASAAMFAYISGSPFVFMELHGVSEERFGLFFGANALGLIVASQVNGAIARRVHPRTSLRWGLAAAAAAGLALAGVAWSGAEGFAWVLAPLFVFMCSLGFIYPATIALALAPHGRVAGSASAVFGFVQFLLSGAGAMIVSLLHDGTARPMAGVIAASAAAALVINLALAGASSPARSVEEV